MDDPMDVVVPRINPPAVLAVDKTSQRVDIEYCVRTNSRPGQRQGAGITASGQVDEPAKEDDHHGDCHEDKPTLEAGPL